MQIKSLLFNFGSTFLRSDQFQISFYFKFHSTGLLCSGQPHYKFLFKSLQISKEKKPKQNTDNSRINNSPNTCKKIGLLSRHTLFHCKFPFIVLISQRLSLVIWWQLSLEFPLSHTVPKVFTLYTSFSKI